MAKQAKNIRYFAWATAWGPMGAAASDKGLVRVVLPHYQLDQLEQLLTWDFQGAVKDEAPFTRLVELSRAYFNGVATDFSELACDGGVAFAGEVYRVCRTIPYGQTTSYHMLAEMMHRPDAARAVAAALGKNPTPLVVPCHRVTYADGRCGGFSAPGGEALKMRMLELEKKAK